MRAAAQERVGEDASGGAAAERRRALAGAEVRGSIGFRVLRVLASRGFEGATGRSLAWSGAGH